MKKALCWILLFGLILGLAGCQSKEPTPKQVDDGPSFTEVEQSQSNSDIQKPQSETTTNSKTLPPSYPKEILPLAADAEIIDVRENPASNGLEVMYISGNDIGTLRDFYEGMLNDAQDLGTDETPDGYLISAKIDGVSYSISLSKDAMNTVPQYAGKISVYIIMSGLDGISDGPKMPNSKGEVWPSADLPGVPQLNGYISQVLREDGIIRLEITVENAEKVKNYVGELVTAGFSFDAEPDIESNHMEFLAFKDSGMMSFAYKGEEDLVSIEYQK